MALRDALLAEFDHEMATTRKLLERVPEASLPWKPHEKSMSLGGLSTHLSNIPHWTGILMERPSFDLADAPPNVAERTSRQDILRLFDDTTKDARSAMNRSDGEWTAMWSLKRSGREMFSMPRAAAFLSFVMSHMIHHRGQLTVYLRLLNVPLPAIYGPTADEPAF